MLKSMSSLTKLVQHLASYVEVFGTEVESDLTELRAFKRTEFLLISVLRVASGPRVKLACYKSAFNPRGLLNNRSKAVVPVLVLLFVALWFILRGDLFCVLLCVILFLCFSAF